MTDERRISDDPRDPYADVALPYPFPDFPPRRPLVPTLRVGAAAVLVAAVVGVPFGLLWRWIAPDTDVVQSRIGPYPVDPQPEQFVAADGWFAILGFVLGLAFAVTAWFVLRRHRGPVLLIATVLGGFAAAVVGWQVGRWHGHADFVRWKATAALGTPGVQPPDLRFYGVLLVPAFAAVIAYTLLAGWSHDPELTADRLAADGISSGWPAEPAQTAAPAPPAPDAAAPPPD